MRGFVVCLIATLVLCCLGTIGVARAEDSKTYIAVFGGLTFLQEFEDVKDASEAQRPNRDVSPGPMYGAKLGFIPAEDATWFGIEAEVFGSQTEVSSTGFLHFTDYSMIYAAVNGMLRYPAGPIQPYIGGGPSLVWGNSRQLDTTKPNFGLNLLAGTRFILGERLFLFGEFKHNTATLKFQTASFRNSVNAVVGGVALTF